MIHKNKILGILVSLVMISSMPFQFAFAAQTDSNVDSNTNNTQIYDEGNNGDQQNASRSDTGSTKASRRAPEADTVTDLSKYLTDKSTVQFKYEDPDTKNTYTVNYSLSSGNVSKDGNTDIKDKDGKDLDLYQLKNIRVLLSATFSDDEKITTDHIFTYTLPDSQGVTWTGSTEWQDLKGSDGTSYGSYQVAGNKLQIKFNKTFINLENRYASVTIDSTFDNSGFTGDKSITFTFPGIGTFVGKLVVPKTLAIKKMDSMVNVGKNTDIIDVAENNTRTKSTILGSDSTYPYIKLADDGAYLTQLLKVTVTGDQSGLVIEDYYGAICKDKSFYFNAENNNWKYYTTIKLVKKAADGTVETLTEGTDYFLSDRDGVVRWTLKNGVKNGDEIYVAYRAKFDNKVSNEKYDTVRKEDGDWTRSRALLTSERDCARTISDDVTHYKYDSIINSLGNYGVTKFCDSVDTEKKTAHWIVYYNLGANFFLLDGQTIRDAAKSGKLTPDSDSINVTLIPAKDRAENINASQFGTEGIKLVTNGKPVKDAGYGDWSNFSANAFMSSNGYTIPAGTGCGALKIEFTTHFADPVSNARGSSYSIENLAYFNKYFCSDEVDVTPTGLAYPSELRKGGYYAKNDLGEGDYRTGRMHWNARFAINTEMKLEYRDQIGIGQRLLMDDLKYPMTLTYKGAGGKREIDRYQEGISSDSDAVYYDLKINDNIDKTYETDQLPLNFSDFTKASFVIRFVNNKGEEVKLKNGEYTLSYYTYFSPLARDDGYPSHKEGDYGYYQVRKYQRNYAWLVYNDGKNYMSDYGSVFSDRSIRKGSDATSSSYTGDSESVPKELKPKAADELFWSFTIDTMTETTSKLVLKDTFKLDGKAWDPSEGTRLSFEDPMKLKKDRFIVYNGDNKLSPDQYELEETSDGFRLTLSKEKGYDPTKNIKAYYMTKVPIETMKQGDVHHYGNMISIEAVYDEEMTKKTGKETAFLKEGSVESNGDYQTYRYRLLSKGDDYDPSTQYITYSVAVNPYELILNDGKTVELTDTMDEHLEYDVDADGKFVVPVQVLDENGKAIPSSDYKVELSKKKDGTFGPLKLTVPDGKRLTIKYRARVKPGVSSLTDIKAVNSVNFSTGNYRNAETSNTVTLTNLSASAGGTPVYLTTMKTDADDHDQLLDGAEYQVTVYQRQENSDGSYELVQEGDPETKTTKDGVFTNKTSYGHVIKIQEMKAPDGYLRDDRTEHYYIVERPDEGTKDQWKERYKDTFLNDVNWDNNVEMVTSNRQKTAFQDTANKTDVTAEKIWSASDGKTADISDHGTDVYFKLYKKTKSSAEGPVAVDGAAVKKVPSSGKVTWKGLEKYTDQDRNDEWQYSVKETDADGNDLTPAGYSKKEEGLKVTNTRNEITKYLDDSMTVVKVDGEDDRPLENATFTIYSDPECRKPVQVNGNNLQFVTDEKGKAELSTAQGSMLYSLRPAEDAETTYYFKETSAPIGYKLSDKIRSFMISADRVSKWDESHSTYVNTITYTIKGKEIKSQDGEKSVSIGDQRERSAERVDGRLTLIKQDGKDGTLLSGAQFTLYEDQGCTKKIKTYTTDSTGTLVIDTGDEALKGVMPSFDKDRDDGDASVDLYLKETKAPDGYRSGDTVYPVRISGKRTSTWSDDHSSFITNTTYEITSGFSNELTIKNNKVVKKNVPVDKNDKNIRTGDNIDLLPYASLMLVSWIALVLMLVEKKSGNKKSRKDT